MSQEEESSGRVTRGALRRRSIDQDTSIGPGTPKKTAAAAASAKKGPALDAILETNGTAEGPVNKAVQKLKESEPEKASVGRRSRATSLTEDTVDSGPAASAGEVRRTPRRRPSQDVSVTPQTAPAATRRMTRRNSVTSDDGSVSTPKVTAKSRLNVSVAPPTIVEDDEKETAEADLSDLDIRKLRNRSISNSPVPRGSPTGKNTSIKEEDSNTSLTKPVSVLLQDVEKSSESPKKAEQPAAETSVVEMEPLVVAGAKLDESSAEKTPSKAAANTSQRKSVSSGSAAKLQKSVTFDEAATPDRQNLSAYPRTPVPASAEKSFKFDEEEQKVEEPAKNVETVKSPPEVFEIDETMHESPKEAPQPKPEPVDATPQADQSVVLDQSLANIVEDVRENLAANAAGDLSMSILGTPAKPKVLLPRLREGSCSTPKLGGSSSPKANTPDGRGRQKTEADGAGEKLSKSWSQAVKGSADGKGIDVFSVRKQEEQERKDEEAKKLNESLKAENSAKKRKSPKKKVKEEEEEEEDDEEVGVSELLGGESSQESNFMDDEAEDAGRDYESGDSMDSEERQEMEENEVVEHGESIGSEDSEDDEDEEDGDDDSFIAPEDDDEEELLDGTGDDLSSDGEQDKSKTKKRKRIIQVEDTSDDEKEISKKNLSTVSLDRTTTASENSTVEVAKSPKKTPVKVEQKSPKKQTPVKQDPTEPPSELPKSRKSMPAAALISADFYSPAAKKAKRATINVLATEPEEPAPIKKPAEAPGLLANPAALALAKKNAKRQSLDQPSSAKPENKRASLPGKLPADKQLDKSLVKPKKQQDIPEEPPAAEPMEVDEENDDEDVHEQVVPQTKPKKAKDLSEFDTDAILSRCNEIVRADKERKKQSATLKQKKKDEKRRQREQAGDDAEDDEKEPDSAATAGGSPDKKKKKKKKPINYLLEELGETREEQVARALKRKMALLEAKRERKKAKKAAKLQRQLNKENQDGETNGAVGIGAKFEKKAKKKDKKSSVVEQLVTEPVVEVPKVKLAVSAFQVYKEQIDELKQEQGKGKKKTKQLKEKNQQPTTAVEEVKAALQPEPAKAKKDKKVPEVAAAAPVEAEKPKKKKKTPAEIHQEAMAEQKKLDEELAQIKRAITEPIPKYVKKTKTPAEQRKLDEDLAKLKQALSDPTAKIVKKQKLSHQEKPTVTCPAEVASTPPRKLKALARFESGGFTEEAVTPEQQKIKRNHGFREEPVTPKPVGFKVSAVLPTGQQELAQRAALTKKQHKKSATNNRIRPEDVQEPVRTLPLPVWTRSGTFAVEELPGGGGGGAVANKKKQKKSKSFDDSYIPVNGGKTSSTEFLVKPLGAKKENKAKANRIDLATVDDAVINFKKQAIFGKTAHLREKKSKH